MMSNMTKGLFRRGISHGGSGFSHWGVFPQWRSRGQTDKLAKYFKCPISDSQKLVNCLKTKDPVSVVAAQLHLVVYILIFIIFCLINKENGLCECLIRPSILYLFIYLFIKFQDYAPFPPVTFVPTLEPEDIDGNPENQVFLSETPETLYKAGKVEPKPWILSTTKYEGISAILGNFQKGCYMRNFACFSPQLFDC